jgi:viologen exporter family transport system permease protein
MIAGYRRLATVALQELLVYRVAVLIWVVWSLLQIYLLSVFWTAVYGGVGAVAGVTLPGMLTYAVLSTVQLNFVQTGISWYVQQRVRDGNIVMDLLRPVSFFGSRFAYDLGGLAGNLTIAALTALLAGLFVPLQPPVSIAMAGAYLVSLLLSYSLHFLLMALLACTAFWFTELQGVSAVFWLVLSLLSGAVVPLWFLPPFFQQLSSWLPFQGLVYVPVAIYIGRLTGGAVWLALLQQVIWIGVLSAVLALVWRAALRRLVVQGG